MKKLLTVVFLFLTISKSFCQIPIDSFYVVKESFLIESRIEQFDSISSIEIIKRIKNWAGVNFVNSEAVTVSETVDQLVFNFISPNAIYHKGLGMKYTRDWYVRLVVQVKDNKARFLFYDDGNVFIPASYSGNLRIPATQARSYHVSSMYADKKGLFRKNSEEGAMSFKRYIREQMMSIINYIQNPFSTNSKSDNW